MKRKHPLEEVSNDDGKKKKKVKRENKERKRIKVSSSDELAVDDSEVRKVLSVSL